MLLGLAYVISGLVITVLGRQQWKTRKARRAARKAAGTGQGGQVGSNSAADDKERT
jgi:hypothetical protein